MLVGTDINMNRITNYAIGFRGVGESILQSLVHSGATMNPYKWGVELIQTNFDLVVDPS
jgi:hypothetical protein